jgi:MFS family permease
MLISTTRLCIALFSAQMEATIVSTSVIAITNQLRGFTKSSWIFTGFLLTYCCMFSDSSLLICSLMLDRSGHYMGEAK